MSGNLLGDASPVITCSQLNLVIQGIVSYGISMYLKQNIYFYPPLRTALRRPIHYVDSAHQGLATPDEVHVNPVPAGLAPCPII